MKIYVVASQSTATASALNTSVRAQYGDDCYKLQGDVWLVAGHGTAKDVSEKLAITKDTEPDPTQVVAIVFPTDGYYGRADPAIWQWLDKKIASKTNDRS